MATLPGRLRQAIRLSRFPSIRKFAAAFDERGRESGIRGHSAPVLQRHLDGKGHPPDRAWLEAFADVAGVRLDWLVTGQGPRTDIEERARFYYIALLAGADVTRDVGDKPTMAYLWAVLERLLERESIPPDGEDAKVLAKRLENAVHAPAEFVTGRDVTDLFTSRETYRAYALSVLQAMERALDAEARE